MMTLSPAVVLLYLKWPSLDVKQCTAKAEQDPWVYDLVIWLLLCIYGLYNRF